MAAGTSDFPTSLDTTTNLPAASTLATAELDGDGNANVQHSNLHGVADTALVQIETKLGTGSGAPTAAGKLLRATSASASGWSTLTFPDTAAISTIIYASAADTLAALATANSGVLVTSGTGVPSISSTLPAITVNGVLTLAGNVTRAADQTIDLTGAATRTLTLQNSTASQIANLDIDGNYIWRNGHATGTFTFAGTPTAARTITWQDASDTVVGRNTTDTLTNKTLTAPTMSGIATGTWVSRWSGGTAVTAAQYEITRDADGTNQLHFNVPTGATYEWSINDVATVTATANLFTMKAASGAAFFVADCAVNDEAGVRFTEAGTLRYYAAYDGTNNYWKLWTTDSDGLGADADLIRIPDGQLSIDANTTWDANVFDYVCETCGKHEAEVFTCHGKEAPWHDDVALMAQAARKNPVAIAKMEALGLARVYDDGQLFISMNKLPWFLMSGAAQQHRRIQQLETDLADLRSRIPVA